MFLSLIGAGLVQLLLLVLLLLLLLVLAAPAAIAAADAGRRRMKRSRDRRRADDTGGAIVLLSSSFLIRSLCGGGWDGSSQHSQHQERIRTHAREYPTSEVGRRRRRHIPTKKRDQQPSPARHPLLPCPSIQSTHPNRPTTHAAHTHVRRTRTPRRQLAETTTAPNAQHVGAGVIAMASIMGID